MGKTRLLHAAREAARRRGMWELAGHAVPGAAPPPYHPLTEALRPVLEPGGRGRDPRLGPLTSVLSRLSGQWTGGAELDRSSVIDAVTRVLTMLGEDHSCLLVMDDLQWADPETQEVLERFTHLLSQTRVVCLAATRTGDGNEAERRARMLAERRMAELVELSPLAASDVDALVRDCLDASSVPPSVLHFVRDRADGVPLFVEELLDGLLSAGALVREDGGWRAVSRLRPRVPLTLVESVEQRLAQLSSRQRQVLQAAAVLGRRFAWTVLPRVVAVDRADVLDALRAGVHAGLLVVDEDDPAGFAFRHALGREATLAGLLPAERAEIATNALAAMEAAGWDVGNDLVADLALTAGQRQRAAGALLTSAREGLRRGALASAETALHRARTLVSNDTDLLLLTQELQAQAAALAGDPARAQERAHGVLVVAGPLASGQRRADLHLTLARTAAAAGQWSVAGQHVAEASELADEAQAPGLVSRARVLAAHVAVAEEDPDQAQRLARAVVDADAAQADPAARCEALEVLGRCARPHDAAAAERFFQHALELAKQHDLPLWRARALHELGTVDLVSGTRRRDRLEAAREAAVAVGAEATAALVDLHLCAVGLASWEPETAVADGRRCVDVARRLGLATLGMGLVHLASAHALLGHEAAMEQALAEAAQVAGADADVAAGIPGRARASLALHNADMDAARRHLDDAVVVLDEHPTVAFPFRGVRALLHAARDDDAPQARQQARTAADSGMEMNRCAVTLADALVAGRHGQPDEACRLVTAAFGSPMLRGDNVWGALLLGVAAQAALRGRWGDGAAWCRNALACFRRRDLSELAAWSRALLRDAGETVPRARRDGADVPPILSARGVTRGEVDVLGLLVAGLSNPEIARRLHLSRRTVEHHVSNLLAKTGEADRHGLARLARESGLAP